VQIKVDRGGGVAVFCGSTDIGQGSDSILAYIVAEELGIRPEDIRVVTAGHRPHARWTSARTRRGSRS
jgi:CO/xanthine dehydrogenase Mo-binding subunit